MRLMTIHTDIHTSVHLCLISAQLTESCCFLLWTGEEMKCPENNKVHTDRLRIEPDIYLPGTDHFTMWPGNVSLNSWDKLLMTKKIIHSAWMQHILRESCLAFNSCFFILPGSWFTSLTVSEIACRVLFPRAAAGLDLHLLKVTTAPFFKKGHRD